MIPTPSILKWQRILNALTHSLTAKNDDIGTAVDMNSEHHQSGKRGEFELGVAMTCATSGYASSMNSIEAKAYLTD